MNYFIIRNKKMPWGDYGNILFRGFLNVMDEEFHDLVTPELERTGPYVPDIYIANTRDLVIRDEVKIILEECGVTGIESYREIKKKKIVRLDWENSIFGKSSILSFFRKAGKLYHKRNP